MGRDKLTPKVMPGVKAVSIEMIVPFFFFQYDRFSQGNYGRKVFSKNSHKVTVFEKALPDIRKILRVKKGGDIQNPKVIIPLPFKYEEKIIE